MKNILNKLFFYKIYKILYVEKIYNFQFKNLTFEKKYINKYSSQEQNE